MLLEVKNVSFAYEGASELFHEISFAVEPGEVLCILGPNGVGKTTLLNCLGNLITPTAGEIHLDGKDMKTMKAREVAMRIGFVPQLIIPTFAYEVISYVVTGCAPRIGTFEKPKKEQYEIARDAILQMKLPHLTHKFYTEISGGERQQVSIARALAQHPKVLLMDEPTAHLDYGNQIKVLKIIKQLSEQGFATVLTTHNPDHALLLGGKVAAITPRGDFVFGDSKEIIRDAFLSDLYGIELQIQHLPGLDRDVCITPSL